MAGTMGILIRGLLALVALCGPAFATRTDPANFATPVAAVSALRTALAKDDVNALVAIFGGDHADIVLGADPASGRVIRQRAAAAAREKVVLRRDTEERITLVFGRNNWPMPIPLVRRGGLWMFDAAAGEQEILVRRIGENELAAIDALEAFAEAERKYAAWRRSKGQNLEYAQYVQSTPAQTDGLWWDRQTAAAAGPSPLADFAARNQEFLEGRRPGDPFKGYYFRVLTGQGAYAPGGAMSYLAGGRMTKGFAMIAWPADYESSGIMTFIIGPDGSVLEKDLGEETGSSVKALLLYDPDEGWKPAER
jgi:Protein of unknown function (DUF2950)